MLLTTQLVKKGVQNPRWSAPEIIEGKGYSEKVGFILTNLFEKSHDLYLFRRIVIVLV